MVSGALGNLCIVPRIRRECRGNDSGVARNPDRRRAEPGLDDADESAPSRFGITAPERTPVSVSCTAVALCALLSTVALWRGFEWLGTRAQLASSVWQVGFLVFCVMPALLVGILLLAKDKHLADHTGSYTG